MHPISITRARRLVRQYTAARTVEEAEPIAQHMVRTGDCVWHALSVVTGNPCQCHDCTQVKS